MENLIRNTIFIGAIVVLIIMFSPIRPSGEQIIEFIVPFVVPALIVSVFVFQIVAKIKKQGGNWQEVLKTELKKIETQAYNKKK